MKYIFGLLMALSATSLFAKEYKGTVEDFYINSSNTALINLEPLTEGIAPPSCGSTNGWDFTFKTNTEYGKQWVAMLLSAKMTGKAIRFGFVGSETTYCKVIYVYYYGNE